MLKRKIEETKYILDKTEVEKMVMEYLSDNGIYVYESELANVKMTEDGSMIIVRRVVKGEENVEKE